MKKTSFTIFLLCLCIISANGQVNLAVQSGGQFSGMKIIKGSANDYGKNSIAGFKLGGIVSIPVSSSLLFAPELNIVSKGGRFKTHFFEDQGGGVTLTTDMQYKLSTLHLELPLNFVYVSVFREKLFFGGGPVISCGLDGDVDATIVDHYFIPGGLGDISSFRINGLVKFGTEKQDDKYVGYISFLELGGNIFVGYKLSKRFFLKTYYNRSLKSLSYNSTFFSSSYSDRTAFNYYYYGVNIGYFFK